MRVFITVAALFIGALHATNAQSIAELCAGCKLVNGAGYTSHPTECDKFIHCYKDGNDTLYGEVQPCSFSTYWKASDLTCVPAQDIVCSNDRCRGQEDGTVFGGDGNCRGFWECQDGIAQAKCCSKGERWNNTLAECVDNIKDDNECFNICFNETEIKACDKKELPGKPAYFQQEIHGLFWVPMPCAPGTVFVEDECRCGRIVEPDTAVKTTCARELYLPFTKNHLDQSGKGHYVKNENVEVVDGVAVFNGIDSRLIVPRFTNLQRSTTIIIKVSYTSDHVTSPEEHAVVSNSDCGNDPSILISEDAFNTKYGVGTLGGNFTTVLVPQAELGINETMSMKDLEYIFDEGVLSGSSSGITNSVRAPGSLKNVQCGLHIGDADGLLSFKGEIDELEVFLCNPF